MSAMRVFGVGVVSGETAGVVFAYVLELFDVESCLV